jgi:hypothetical protein
MSKLSVEHNIENKFKFDILLNESLFLNKHILSKILFGS